MSEPDSLPPEPSQPGTTVTNPVPQAKYYLDGPKLVTVLKALPASCLPALKPKQKETFLRSMLEAFGVAPNHLPALTQEILHPKPPTQAMLRQTATVAETLIPLSYPLTPEQLGYIPVDTDRLSMRLEEEVHELCFKFSLPHAKEVAMKAQMREMAENIPAILAPKPAVQRELQQQQVWSTAGWAGTGPAADNLSPAKRRRR